MGLLITHAAARSSKVVSLESLQDQAQRWNRFIEGLCLGLAYANPAHVHTEVVSWPVNAIWDQFCFSSDIYQRIKAQRISDAENV